MSSSLVPRPAALRFPDVDEARSTHPRVERVAVQAEEIEDAEIIELVPVRAALPAPSPVPVRPRSRRVTDAYARQEAVLPRPIIAVG